MASEQNRWLYRFSVITSLSIVLLLIAGGLVTSNNAGDSVPDWPLAYHHLIPPHLIGGIRFEYGHRVVAGLVAVLTLILAVWIQAREKRPLAWKLGWTALGLVVAQAVLGGIRVLDGYPAITATAHAILAQIFFLTVVGLTIYLSPWWRRDLELHQDASSPSVRSLTAWTTAVIFVQLILGACFRHGALGIMPHMIGAAAVAVMVVWAGRAVKKRFGAIRQLRTGVALLHSFFGVQILLGGAAYWAVLAAADDAQPTFTYVSLTVAHVLFGALLFASSLLLTLLCFRVTRPAHSTAAEPVSASPQKASV
ncbi:MAG TPA: COX15/CtaA family protein [Candidatus Acidoferrales bacterium]|nr:COX15/CtaA family protein [Candidatus Acidoferrales bacterium]